MKQNNRHSFLHLHCHIQRKHRSTICLTAVPLLHEQFIERYPIIFNSLERRLRNEPIDDLLYVRAITLAYNTVARMNY